MNISNLPTLEIVRLVKRFANRPNGRQAADKLIGLLTLELSHRVTMAQQGLKGNGQKR